MVTESRSARFAVYAILVGQMIQLGLFEKMAGLYFMFALVLVGFLFAAYDVKLELQSPQEVA